MSYYYRGCGTKYKACDTSLDFIDDGSMSNYEKMCFIIGQLKILTEIVEGFEDELNAKEDSINITDNRKLSETGDFTGTICGEDACKTIIQIDDNKTTIEDIAFKIDNKISIEFIVDGGIYPFTGDPNIEIDGGVI